MAARSELRRGVTLFEFLFGIAIVTTVFAVALFALHDQAPQPLPSSAAQTQVRPSLP